jgi:hypothetical protein
MIPSFMFSYELAGTPPTYSLTQVPEDFNGAVEFSGKATDITTWLTGM